MRIKFSIHTTGSRPAIHSIDYPDHARFIRVTGTNLDKIDRIKIDLKTGTVEKMYAQQAT